MALNSSGPISLGGNTAGQSIALELSLVTNAQISLNDTNVRALAAVPTGAITMPTNFYGKSATTPITATADQTARSYTATQTITSFNPLTAANGVVPYTYAVSSGTLPTALSIAPTTGLVSGTVNAAYAAANVTFNVKDSTNTFATTTSTVNFTVFAQTTATAVTTARVYTNGQGAIASFNPLTASNGTGTYTYSISSGTLPTGLSLNPTTGAVTGTPTAIYAAADIVFTVKDSNNVVAATTATVNFKVNAATTATANTTARVYTNGQTAITVFLPLTPANGTTPYVYSITAGSLPSGLSLNSGSGQVTGTPTATYATANVTFSVTDANGVTAVTTSTVSFTVNAATTATADTTARSGQANIAITSFNPLTAANGTTPYTYAVQTGTLPTGLSLNPSTGLVSGTPTAAYASANVVFRVTDTNGVVAAITSTVNFTYTAAPVTVNYLVVGGGGGGGRSALNGASGFGGGQIGGGGGGGGGVVTGSYPQTVGTVLTITVGTGGTGGTSTLGRGNQGNSSSLTGATTATGGGYGGGYTASNPLGGTPGGPGGSGGGGSTVARNATQPNTAGMTVGPGGTGSQGQPGGSGNGSAGGPPFPASVTGGGGGGGGGFTGAGGTGVAGPNIPFNAARTGVGGPGGAGYTYPFTGAIYGSGGGGANANNPLGPPAAPGGGTVGVGGQGGVINTSSNGNAGSTGTVILVVPTPQYSGTKTGGTTTNPGSAPGSTVITWTAPGSYTV